MILQILIGIAVLISIPIIVIIKLRMNKQIQKIDITANMPKIRNIARKHFTEGYSSGILKQMLPRKNGTHLIEFYPDDVEQGENIPRPQMQSFIVKNEFIKPYARGEISSRREFIDFIGRSALDYPERMRGTTEGDILSKKGQLAFLEATFGKAIPTGDEAMAELMKNWSRTGATRNVLAEIREINAQFRKIAPFQQKEEEAEKPSK